MPENNRKYLLFIFSDFKENQEFVKDIPLQLMPISTSKYLKFNHTDFGMVCNFETDLPFVELREFVQFTLEDLVDQYFLIEHPDNMAAHMPDHHKFNLFNLDADNLPDTSDNDNMSDKQGEEEGFMIMDHFLNLTGDNITTPQDFINMIMSEIEDEDDVDEDPIIAKARMKGKLKDSRPSLDDLLEKIKEKGMESLTKYENQLLNEYARN